MLQAAPPPPPPRPPPPEVVRTESEYVQVARRDMPFTYQRGNQSEKATLRYVLFLRTDTEATRPATPPGEVPSPFVEITCRWTISTFLQREPCVETLSGRMACGEMYTGRFGDRSTGEEKMPGEGASACAPSHLSVRTAERNLRASLGPVIDELFDDDLEKRVKPDLARAGITMKPRAVSPPTGPARR